jgi:hypothetical protein
MWHRAVEQPLRDLLEIPDGVAMSACITLGRPAGQHGPVRRRPLADLVFDDGWGDAAPWAVEPPEVRHTLWRRPTNSVGEVSQGDVSPTEIPIVRSIAP